MDNQPEPLAYEETPVIQPQPESTHPETHTYQAPPVVKKSGGFFGFLKGLLFFIILFAIGFALSGYVRDFFSVKPVSETKPITTPEPTISKFESTRSGETTGIVPQVTLAPKQFTVLNGLTRKAVPDISFTLPASVLPPICDGSACGSQGTYLPGGTRFTIAARGTGQVLADFREKIISDAGGKPFAVSQTTVAGKPATEFTTTQTGSTIGGYAFSRMRGYMIEVTDTLSLEINHFSPSGITADFAADDAVFTTIVQSLVFGPTLKGSVILPGSPVSSPAATPSY